ncbi:MAG: efflux RND transporter periplasmic adaptor subunit [Saprospiraceae bacterium]
MKASSPKRRKILTYSLIGVFLLLIVAAAIKSRQKPKGEEVYVEEVKTRTISETVTASGKVFPETEVKISSDVSGEIVELYVKEGDSVRAGQVLAKIRPDEYQSAVERGQASLNSARSQKEISSSNVQSSQAQIEQVEADLLRAKAQFDAAKKTHQRNEQLHKEGIISDSDFEASLSNFRTLESGYTASKAALEASKTSLMSAKENVRVADYGINSAQATLKELRTSLQKTVITSPVNGIISKLNVEKGERVVGTLQMTGTELMRVANLSSMEVQVEVSENDILKVTLGDKADIEVDAYLGKKFTGKVTEIANSASNVGGTTISLNTDQVANFVVKVRIDPDSYADMISDTKTYPFRPGMSASVDIFTETTESLSVPLIAVTVREEDKEKENSDEEEASESSEKTIDEIKEVVFVVQADTVDIRDVTTGIQDNDHIVIESGLKEGEMVVTGPYSAIARKLKQGGRITVKDKDEKKKSKE